MWWIIGFLTGIIYSVVTFFLLCKFDNLAYSKGISLNVRQSLVFVGLLIIWPITIWIPKLRTPEFYYGLKLGVKNDTRL